MKRILAACLGVILLLLASCSSFRHHQWRTEVPASNDTPQYSLRFIEADDEGWFWDRNQPEEAIRTIRHSVAGRDTIVVTFVHGWHHCARCCDSNVEGFRQTLLNLHSLLNSRPSQAGFNVVGLYIGWRGQSLPMPLDYLTFWGRKGAAERVGQNDLKEFLARLQALFAELRPDVRDEPSPVAEAAAPQGAEGNFLGLVTIGHSFGAQVVLKAINGSLEDRLLALNATPAYLRDAQPAERDPQQRYSLSGIGDLVVLVNPAAEASQYHRLHILSQGLNYSELQTPVILTLSAENDRSRHRLFTLGRLLGEFFTGKPRKDNEVQRDVERQALGVYPGHVTHRLVPTDENVELISTTIPGNAQGCPDVDSCESTWLKWKSEPAVTRPNSLHPDDPALRTFDFSGFNDEVVFNNVVLEPLPQAAQESNGAEGHDDRSADYGKPQPYQPLLVARASSDIIDDHSGIFTEPFLRFLAPYIAYIEEKSRENVESNKRKREAQQTYQDAE